MSSSGTTPTPDSELLLHATAVAYGGRAVILKGASGSGKSSLALQLISLGATLVADDGVRLWRSHDRLIAGPPARIAGLIEARFVGLMRLPYEAEAEVALVVDLDLDEAHRLPPARHIVLMEQRVTLLHRVDAPHFPQAILLCLSDARTEP